MQPAISLPQAQASPGRRAFGNRAQGTVPTPAADREAWQAAVNNPNRRIGFYFGLAYIFLRYSSLHETLTMLLGIQLYLALVLGLPAVILCFIGGGFQRSTRSGASLFWLAFVAFLLLSIPFSTWKGESFTMVVSYLRTDFPMMFILGGMVLTWKECKMVLMAMGVSGVATLAMEKFFASMDEGRMSLMGGSIANANDYAAHLLMLLPFVLWMVIGPVGRIYKFLFLPFIFLGLFFDLKTGSRGALIGMAAGFVYIMFKGPGKLRILLGLCGPVAVVASFFFLPATVLFRFTNLIGDPPQETASASAGEDTTGAVESSQARRMLLMKSLQYTLEHPLYGIGPGNFSSYEGGLAREAGKRGQWQETHNSYTQVSSEAGIPAVICYIAAILSTVGILSRTMAQARKEKRQAMITTVFCTQLSLIVLGTTMAFLSLGYKFYMPALTGLALTLDRIMRFDPPLPNAPKMPLAVAIQGAPGAGFMEKARRTAPMPPAVPVRSGPAPRRLNGFTR